MVNGKPIYGNESYIKMSRVGDGEDISWYVGSMSDWVNESGRVKHSAESPGEASGVDYLVTPPLAFERAEDKEIYLNNLSKWIVSNGDKFEGSTNACSFDEKKIFVHQQSGHDDVVDLYQRTGLNLDRMQDIQKLVAVGLMTQSRNIHDQSKGKFEYRAKYFPRLFTCADEYQKNRLINFVKSDSTDDEFSRNLENASDAQEKCSKFDVCRKKD